jgi:hypothetical protein
MSLICPALYQSSNGSILYPFSFLIIASGVDVITKSSIVPFEGVMFNSNSIFCPFVIDRGKLILDKERLELEFNKVLKDIHILERGYRHDVSKLNIGIIKEITDSISIVMKLVTLGKSLFSGD